jgi:hypothetical protein
MLKPILPSRETMTMRSRSLAELTQWIERAATLSRAPGLFWLRQGSRSGMVCGEIPQHALFEVA